MRIIYILLKITLLIASLGLTTLHAEPAVYDDAQYSLELPSVALLSDGETQGYFSVSLQILSDDNGFTVLDNAYATALFGQVQPVPMTNDLSATYNTNTQELIIPALAFSKTANAPTQSLTLHVLTTLDGAFVLGL